MSFTNAARQKLQNLIFTRLQLPVQFFDAKIAVRTDAVAAFAFCTVKGGIGHFDKLDRIA